MRVRQVRPILDRRRIKRHALKLVPSRLLGLFEILVEGPFLEQMLQPRFLAVSAIAIGDIKTRTTAARLC